MVRWKQRLAGIHESPWARAPILSISMDPNVCHLGPSLRSPEMTTPLVDFAFLSPSAYHDALAVQAIMKFEVGPASPRPKVRLCVPGYFYLLVYAQILRISSAASRQNSAVETLPSDHFVRRNRTFGGCTTRASCRVI